MQYFRRTLLCLVVGVTAFGVAGWGFRPRASWALELGGDCQRFRFCNDSCDGVWILGEARNVDESDGLCRSVLWNIDVPNVRVARRIPIPNDVYPWPTFRCDGKIVFSHASYDVDAKKHESFVAIVEPNDDREPDVFSLNGKWDFSRDGTRMWRAIESDKGLKIIRRRVGGDWKLDRLELDARYSRFKFGDGEFKQVPPYTISDDGSLLALSQKIRADDVAPYGLELWSLDERRCLQSLPLPKTPTVPGDGRGPWPIGFLSDKSELEVSWNDGTENWFEREWFWRFPSNDFVSRPRRADIEFPGDDQKRFSCSEWPAANGLTLRTARAGREDPEFWFTLLDQGATVLPWRKYPFEFPEDRRGGCIVTSYAPSIVTGARRDAFVAVCSDKPLDAAIPESWRRFVPQAWRDTPWLNCHRWHQWETNEWRDVGCPSNVAAHLMLDDRFLTVARSESGSSLLQSWPLPPRDPKWPALGVAGLCMAATWWVCAKRYARRLRLAA